MTNIKRILSLMLILTLAVGMVAMNTSAAKFLDVASSYSYSSEVQFLSDLGIITGYSDGSYKPEGIVTRAEAAAVIYRMLSGKTSAANYVGDTKFPDVSAGHWSSGYVNFAVELGVVNGYPDGNFYPDQTLTYAEYVTMLVRALGLDNGKSPAFPYGYIAMASIEGVNASVDLQADQSCTRGAVAKLTYNSILDATYARMANNIYVTEKPTIAKNILKLNAIEGVLTSAGYYDFIGSNPAGEGKFRLDKVYTSGISGGTYVTSSGTFIGKFNVDVSDLGKKAKVWYKTDSSSASGDKVYAVITEDSNVVSYNHYDIKGNLDATKHELTYVINDDDKILKFSDTANFISNNQWIGVSTLSNPYQDTFYPSSKREWLPITYTFIDNDKDGKYDFAIRKSYGFAKVVNMTSSKLQLDGQPSIDRLDDSDNSYDWNNTLSGISVDDYVLYYADGATNIGTNPSFSSSLYSDTNHALFTKIAKKTGTLNSIVNGDEFLLDGISYRTLSGGENPDLLSSSELGKTYDYYPIAEFGIVAKSELQDPSSGKYIIVTAKAAASLGSNFDISTINESGKNEVYTVKGSTSSGLLVYNKTSSAITMGDSTVVTANSSKTVPLTIANVNSTVGGTFGSNFYEYTLDSAGKISSLKSYIVPSATIDSGNSGYNNTSKLVVSTNGTYLVDDSTLVFVKQGASTYKVFTGNFPKITDTSATNTVQSVDFQTSSGTNKLRAMYITTNASSVTGSSSNSGVAGYLRSVSKLKINEEWYYKYTIAYAGSDSSEFYSKSVDSDADLAGMLSDEGLPSNSFDMGGVVTFDINNDGTISNMVQKKTINNVAVNSDGDYYGTHKVVDIDTSNRVLTIAPLTGAAVTAGARLTGLGTDTTIIGTTTPVLDTNVITGSETSYRYDADVKVYVFDWNSTDQESVTVESIGSIQRSTTNDLYMISFGFDTDDYVITDIFFNKRPYTTSSSGSSGGGSTANAKVSYIGSGYVIIDGTQYTTVGSASEFFANNTSQLINKNISFELTTNGYIYKITAINGDLTLNANYSPFSDLTVEGNLTFTGNNSYTASNVTVTGNLTVGTGGATNLAATHFDVTGTTTVNSTGTVSFNSELHGTVTVTAVGTGTFTNVVFGSNVIVNDTGVTFSNSTITGNFTTTSATAFINNVAINGTITGAASIDTTGASTTTQTNVASALSTSAAQSALVEVTISNGTNTGTIKLTNSNAVAAAAVEYSINSGTWIDLAKNASADNISANAGDVISLRVDANPNLATRNITVALADIKQATMTGAAIVETTDIVTGLTSGTNYQMFINSDWITYTADTAGEIKPSAHSQNWSAGNTVQIRIKATSAKPASIPQTITVTTLVNAVAPVITTNLTNKSTPQGTAETLDATSTVTDGGTISYAWYSDTDATAGGGTAIASQTGATYSPPVNVAGTFYYYCVVTNTNNAATGTKTATTTSAVSTVTVTALVNAVAPVITTNLTNKSTPQGTAETLDATSTVTDGGTISYAWYSDTDATAGGGTAIAGQTGETYSPPVNIAGTFYYYCVVTNTNNGATGTKTATTTSAVSTVTVTALVNAVGGAEATEGTKTITYTLTTGTFAVAATTIGNWTIAGTNGAELGAITGVVLSAGNTVATVTVTNNIGATGKVYTIAPTQAALATGVQASGAATVSITAAAGTLQFNPVTVTASEASGTATLTVTRTGGSAGAASVNYAVTGGTATGSGTDYTLASETVNFADGDSASKTITVSLINDTAVETDETVIVTLSGATGASLGADNVATLTITSEDVYATTPSSILLAVGSTEPVGGVTNVSIPNPDDTDSTGTVTGWVTGIAHKIKITVSDSGSASTITINGSDYTSGDDYTIAAATNLTVVVTTTEAGKVTCVRTFIITVTAP